MAISYITFTVITFASPFFISLPPSSRLIHEQGPHSSYTVCNHLRLFSASCHFFRNCPFLKKKFRLFSPLFLLYTHKVQRPPLFLSHRVAISSRINNQHKNNLQSSIVCRLSEITIVSNLQDLTCLFALC